MKFFVKLWYFLRIGRTTPETWDEQRARERRKEPLIGGFKVILLAFVFLAIVAKLIIESLTGNSFDLSIEGLLTGFALMWCAAIVVFFIVILRILFIWRYGEPTQYGEFKPGGGCGTALLIIVGVAGLLTLYIRHSYDNSQDHRTTAPLIVAEPEPGSEPAPRVERANVTGSPEQLALIARLDALYADVSARWRADVSAAGASGELGTVPPMLEITARDPDIWQVRNLARSPACVRLVRVAKSASGLSRCRLDATTECVEVSAGAVRDIALPPHDASPGCREAKLEFRVGTPMLPEPSWWSATALEHLDADGSNNKSYWNWPAARMRSEIKLLESMTVDPNRAARWRRELAGTPK